jgi:hypothetical protein
MSMFHASLARPNVVSSTTELPVAEHATPGAVARTRSRKSYVVQVALSVVAFDPRSVPHLGVFDSYHMYCDTSVENGLMRNALRLGFFTEARTAEALVGYLASYFDSPRVVKIDAAEQARSAHHKFVALKDVSDSGEHLDVELLAPRPLPTRLRLLARAVPRHRSAGRSLWSRLVGHAR